MNTCWKCGDEIPEAQSECVECLEGFKLRNCHPSAEDLERWDQEFKRDFMEVDWSKVKTLEDVIFILANHAEQVFVAKDSPHYDRLKKFLKPID